MVAAKQPKQLALVVSLIFLAAVVRLEAQTSTNWARVLGTVSDQSGGVVPGVEVTAQDQATNVTRTAVTDERGNYLIDKLNPGIYTLSCELVGFNRQVARDVRLAVGQRARVDFVMTPGEIQESVLVTGVSTTVDTATAELGAVIEEKKVIDLPLQERNVFKLAQLVPGGANVSLGSDVFGTGGTSGTQVYAAEGAGLPAFNGMIPQNNSMQFDGANNRSHIRAKPASLPVPETVQEFKVVTSNYSAEYGQIAGAVVNIVSKSGTNEFHGYAWEYLRNQRFDANNFFANRSRIGKLPLDQHTFGGAVGGPIRKDSTFFYATYERFINDFAVPAFLTVPTADHLKGDFSKGGPLGNQPIHDPFNVVDGQRVPFPNNVIPDNRISPISRKVLQTIPYPTPNQTGLVNNYAYQQTSIERKNKVGVRIDHHFDKDTLFGRFNWQNFPRLYQTGRVGLPGMLHGVYQAEQDLEQGTQAVAGWVKPIGSTLVLELNTSVWQAEYPNQKIYETNWLKELGYDIADRMPSTGPDGLPGPAGLPAINISGHTGYGGVGHQVSSDWGFNIKETASWSKGNHYLKIGFEHIRNLDVRNRWVPEGGISDSFDGFSTGQITGATTSSQGQPFADFLLGVASSSSGNLRGGGGWAFGGTGQYDKSNYSIFLNDDWRVSPDVTLNLGVRWEIPLPYVFDLDKGDCFIDITGGRDKPVQIVPKGFPIDASFVTGGDRSVLAIPFRERDTRRCMPEHYRNIAPRFGMAWRLFGTNQTVFRLGAGLSYDDDYGVWIANSGYLGPFGDRFSDIQVRGQQPALVLGRYATRSPLAASRFHNRGDQHIDPYRQGHVYSYNLSVQHELSPGTKVEVAYVGNTGRHMINRRYWNQSFPEGFVIPDVASGKQITLTGSQRDRRLIPAVDGVIGTFFDGNSNYNSLQIKADRRFRNGLGFDIGYTWAKGLFSRGLGAFFDTLPNEYDRRPIVARTRWDRTHTFYAGSLWSLPVFKNSAGLTRTFLSGWQASTIITMATGAPYRVNVSQDIYNLGGGRKILPNRIADGTIPESQRTVDRFFDVSAFVVPSGGNLGNSNMYPLEGDGIPLIDLGLHKSFAIGESKAFDFRAEMFNAFNHPVFDTPNGSIDTGSAGRVTSASFGRQIQFGFRFSF